jgi:hypothetical protein
MNNHMMRDLVDIAGSEGDCGEGKPIAVVVYESGYFNVMVGNNCICRFDAQSNDYAFTDAQKLCDWWNCRQPDSGEGE